MAQPYANGAEILVQWKHWRDEVWEICPFGSTDKTRCSAQLCPCTLLQVNRWVNRISGYLGTVKLVKYLHGRDGSENAGALKEEKLRIIPPSLSLDEVRRGDDGPQMPIGEHKTKQNQA
jgi:hypothetical protein